MSYYDVFWCLAARLSDVGLFGRCFPAGRNAHDFGILDCLGSRLRLTTIARKSRAGSERRNQFGELAPSLLVGDVDAGESPQLDDEGANDFQLQTAGMTVLQTADLVAGTGLSLVKPTDGVGAFGTLESRFEILGHTNGRLRVCRTEVDAESTEKLTRVSRRVTHWLSPNRFKLHPCADLAY